MLVKKDPLNLTGKVAVITGGSSGIGLGVVELLSAYGAKTAMVDVNPKGEEKAKELRDAGREVTFYHCDVTNEAQVEETVKEIIDTDLSQVMNSIFYEDNERHNKGGAIQNLTHDQISRIDLTETAYIMALTKYINGDV